MAERATYTIGRLYARSFRRSLRDWGLEFSEDRGWLDSHFVVIGNRETLAVFHDAFKEWVIRTEPAR
jgi:hypothetical protein